MEESYTKEQLDEISRILRELELYKKAYDLMAIKYCEHTRCNSCEVNDVCEYYQCKKRDTKFLKLYFLREVRNEL